jgi:hypothetical protein
MPLRVDPEMPLLIGKRTQTRVAQVLGPGPDLLELRNARTNNSRLDWALWGAASPWMILGRRGLAILQISVPPFRVGGGYSAVRPSLFKHYRKRMTIVISQTSLALDLAPDRTSADPVGQDFDFFDVEFRAGRHLKLAFVLQG